MEIPAPAEMRQHIGALPTAAPLLAALGDRPGVYLVGGAVRDLLLGRKPLDLDVLVEGDALALARALGGEIRSHDRFGTGTVRLDGCTYDLASARRERYAYPGALPDVAPATAMQDLERRDFTVNALAVGLTGPRAGVLIAVPHALEDLEGGRMRVLHPASFADDPTRLLRLVRYATRLGFEVEAQTADRARDAVVSGAVDTVSGPRIGAELRLAAQEPDPVAAVAGLAALNLDHAIDPGLRLSEPELAGAALGLLPAGGRADRLVLAAAAARMEPGALATLLDRLGFEAPDRQAITATVRAVPTLVQTLAAARSPSEVASAVGRAPDEAVALAGALGPEDAARLWLDRLRGVRLEISGDDLLAAGIASGPALGRGLAAALAAKLDGRAPDRARELQVALAAAGAQE